MPNPFENKLPLIREQKNQLLIAQSITSNAKMKDNQKDPMVFDNDMANIS